MGIWSERMPKNLQLKGTKYAIYRVASQKPSATSPEGWTDYKGYANYCVAKNIAEVFTKEGNYFFGARKMSK